MDDGEVSQQIVIPNCDSSSNIQASVSVDSFLDELLRNAQTCTHTHTCNPPGPDAAHTHTCYHTHTQVIQSEEVDVPPDGKNLASRSSGNREAVRKYREKKKAHTAYLEEEVKKLRFVNQQLVRKVQRQAILEAEILRLRGVLLDLRGKIDYELGSFPFGKECNFSSTMKEGDCGMQYCGEDTGLQCENDLNCFRSGRGSSVQGGGFGGSDKMGSSRERNCHSAIFANCQDDENARRTTNDRGPDSMETMVSCASQLDE